MRRHSRASGKPARPRRSKSSKSKSRNPPKDASSRSSRSGTETEVAQLSRELKEALEQQTATAEILASISGSTGDTRHVFEAILDNLLRLFGTRFALILLIRDGMLHVAGLKGEPGFEKFAENYPLPLDDRVHAARAILAGRALQIVPVIGNPEAAPITQKLGVEFGYNALLSVPMIHDGKVIGVLNTAHRDPIEFTDKQVTLIKSFAAQAVIAIENARLLNELRQRTTDLSEALEQQTATSEVLQVISSSPGELQPVFSTMLEKAVRICDARVGNIYRLDDDVLTLIASHNTTAFADYRSRSLTSLVKSSVLGRMLATKAVVHVADLRTDEAYSDRNPLTIAAVEIAGVRTILAIPMLKEGELIGAFTVSRQEVRPFSEKEISLLQNFAAQAVIAIENARLLAELRQRTMDLTESLEQQTGTADVLRIISSSPGELEPVFRTILENATRICGANFGIFSLREGEAFRNAAVYNMPEAYMEFRRRTPLTIGPKHPLARLAATRQVVHVADLKADDGYREGDPSYHAMVDLAAARTLLLVPTLKEKEIIGVITIFRQEARLFTDKQIELVKNFAAQAVIAIENARLLNELRQSTKDLNEALEQQTATSEVLSIISSSSGQLNPVFQAMLEKACRICEATCATMQFHENGAFRLTAAHNVPPPLANARRNTSVVRPGPWHPFVEVAATKKAVHINDYLESRAYQQRDPLTVQLVELGGARTVSVVPMLKDQELIGVIAIFRQEVRSFNDKQIELVQSFAAQAVIAIENAQLLNDLRERTAQLEVQSREVAELNQQLEHRVADQVGEIERMSRLRRFLPPQVADLIVASGTEKQLESHRREITALFCDLRGFTGFTESADAEDVMALLRNYHAAIGEIIIKYSGTLERYAGDGVMVVFNDPVPVEKPALQAVLMALEMRNVIGALTEKWRRLGNEIGFGIGIAHGFATLGTIGFEGRFDYAAIGTVANVASRLCDEAKPGQILISPRVLMAVEDAVTVEPVGEFTLKGIRRPLAAYNVLGAAGPAP
jgi:GAF domain-containing protein